MRRICGSFEVRGAVSDGWRPPSPPTVLKTTRRGLLCSSCPGATRASSFSQKKMDCPVKPGNDKSKFLHLAEFELHRRRTPEDRHRHLDARASVIDFLDHAIEGRERPVRHPHLLADFKRDRRL